MSKRSKSAGRQGRGIFPPVAKEEKSFARSKQTSLRDLSKSYVDLPSTSAVPNGRLMSAYMNSSSMGPRSVFSRKNTYGRNESSEMLNDVRDQLFDAKKHIAELNQKNKILNTQLNRVTRESERREAHLQSIMVGRFQPAEMNDTHLAVTLTTLEKQRFENEQIINAQAHRIRDLEKFNNDRDIEEILSDDDDYPEGFHFEQEIEEISATKGRASRSTIKRVPEDWMEKHKRKLELAKAHVEQNKELKAKLKELSTHLAEAKKKLYATDAAPIPKPRVSTAEVNRIMSRIKENGLLKQQVDSATKELRQKLDEKTKEIEQLMRKYNALKVGVDSEKETIQKKMEEVKLEQLQLEDERNKLQDEHNLRELQQEQLSGEMTALEEERRRIAEERNEWTKMRSAYEKQQISMEKEMKQMEDVVENLRRDNSTLRRRMSDLLQTTISDTKVQQKVLEMENKSRESSPSRQQNIPRLDMRDMSVENTSPELPSVNSHTSQLPPTPSAIWDARINYITPGVVAHIIRQDAILAAVEETKNNTKL